MKLRQTLVSAVLAAFTSFAFASAAEIAAVSQRIEKFIDAGEIPGAVTLVGEKGSVVHLSAVGLANIEKNTPMSADTLFGIMSMTKPITGTALMILVEEGKLSLDDPVERFIPAFADAKTSGGDPVEGLTIRRLLTHTSGLVGDQSCEDSLEATAHALAKRPFAFQPGEKWEYGPSLNVCGRIIEVASGQPYEQFLAERIFEPLGMNNTTFHPTTAQRERMAELYRIDGDSKSLVPAERWRGSGEPGSVPNPSGGLFSTASDMFRFYQAILNGGTLDGKRILPAEAVEEMLSVQTGELTTGFTPGNGWGLGWCLVREPQNVTGMLSPGTFGHGGAYGTEGWVDPVKKRIFVLMIQRSDMGNTDASDIRKEFQQVAVEALDSN